jgi:hypothetical protein
MKHRVSELENLRSRGNFRTKSTTLSHPRHGKAQSQKRHTIDGPSRSIVAEDIHLLAVDFV